MRLYTVHVKAAKDGTTSPDAEADAVFVPEGFTLWAFIFRPLWALYHRLWLVAAVMALVLISLSLLYTFLGLSPTQIFLIDILVAFVIGAEANDMRRWTLARRGYVQKAVVSGDTLEEAELRYYHGAAVV